MQRLLLAILLCAVPAEARNVAVAASGAVTITLTDERCKLKEVTNLPYRATWREGQKTFEGCFGIDTTFGAVAMYFDDKTVAFMPASAFRSATEL